jgi:putative transposase
LILTYKYRLLPSKRQHRALEEILEAQRILYNSALEGRIWYYKNTRQLLSLFDQTKELTICRREMPEMAAIPTTIQRWTLKHLDWAYRGFFRRIRKAHKTPGFPRFKSYYRWRSFGFNQTVGSFRFGDNNHIGFKGFPGWIRIHYHRPLPKKADVKSCSFTKDTKGWYITFQIKLIEKTKCTISSAVGIDLGLKVFAYQSDGVIIPNPRVARKAEKEMRRRQRALARCKKGSKRRIKVRVSCTRLSASVTNARNTWLHQQSARIVRSYDLIAVEDLNVKNMLQNSTFARSISDASWSGFLTFLAYKAERAGKYLVRVDPKNTTKKCSGCGELVPKAILERTHSCPECGLTLDRDHNAARNILAVVADRGEHNVAQWGERALGNLSLASSQSSRRNLSLAVTKTSNKH